MDRISALARGVIMTSAPGFGGYILFPPENAPLEKIRALTDQLRASPGVDEHLPPIIAIDQEGGRVMRLQDGVEPMPSMMALGAAGDLELAGRAGEQIAFDLRRAGCTLDFAPVLDLATNANNTVIGTRSFGADPQQVAALGLAFARGLQRGGILPCYKHFPGHGPTEVDSHEALPTIDADEASLRARDLIPFVAVAAEAPTIMSAHILARAFDPERPSTLSRRIATELLRRELGFRGAFVTDCLEMQAVAARGADRNAVDALAAGADLLLFSHDSELAAAAANAIEAAVNDGRVSRERLAEAHGRVLNLREAGAPPLPLDAFPPHPGIGREIARRAMTLVRGIAHADPLADIAVSFGSERPTLEREAAVLQELCMPIDPTDERIEAMLVTVERSQRRPIALTRRAHLHPGQANGANRIVERFPDALVISLLEPFDLPLFPNVRHLIAAYGDDPASIGGLADVLFGGSMPTGQLPVSLPPVSS
ncbi:MAG TPA: glycoside hydrolase family 3 N-terminal domain-containing protein [Candidatus Cybelea sp.]|jgi:beta-N-acetylhexosaminidase|nr:glycoside hydrolase family 3 N-terminal domain-containing protein [Candidatus Cybelea sp.]